MHQFSVSASAAWDKGSSFEGAATFGMRSPHAAGHHVSNTGIARTTGPSSAISAGGSGGGGGGQVVPKVNEVGATDGRSG